MSTQASGTGRKGRGAASNRAGRFETTLVEPVDDGWERDEDLPPLRTTLEADRSRSVIATNDSPDIPFSQSINPYRGCEHGCVYCYARPTHAYLNLSPGLDFETRLYYKANAAALLEEELRRSGYRCEAITLGANTDPYQPVERRQRVTRSLLEVLRAYRHPVSIVTKGGLVERDLDLLASMAERRLASVMVSVTTLDPSLKRTLEPRAASPARRLAAIRRLTDAGVPVGVLVAPVIPAVNDAEIEHILEACAEAGALTARYVLLRLPHEVKDIFHEWLHAQLPLKADHVKSLVRQMSGGRDYDARFGMRQSGTGHFAALLARRFATARRRLHLNARDALELDASQFQPPPRSGDQMTLL